LILISREVNDFNEVENRVLERIFGSKKREVKEDWKHKNREEPNSLYFPRHVISEAKSRLVRWMARVPSIIVMRNAYDLKSEH
jgi:hypothetical protein